MLRKLGERLPLFGKGILSFWMKNRIFFACFGLPAFIMMVVYMGRGVYPVADHSVLVLDLNAQYIYYYEAFRQAFYEGKSLLYNWSQSLSGELIGITGYYLASPFMLVYLLFPKEAIVEALFLVTLLKAGALGLSFAIYLRRTLKLGNIRLLMMSTLYALMAYTVVHAMNPMWIDAVILLPFIALGMSRLVDEKRFVLFYAALTLTLVVNYYIGYMLCIFCLPYFLYLYFAKAREGGLRAFAASAARVAGIGILSVLTAAFILLPVYYSLQLGKVEFSNPDYSLKLRYSLFYFFPKLLFDSYDSVNVQGLPFVYSGLPTLYLLPVFFFAPGIPIRKKVATGGLLLVLFAIMNISILDIAMHGFRIPNWLNHRYSFVFSFAMLAAAAEGFVHLAEVGRDKLIKTYGVLMAAIVIIQLSNITYLNNFTSIWLSILLLSVYAILIPLVNDPRRGEVFLRAFAFLMAAELIANTAFTLQDIHLEVYYSSRSSYVDFMKESRPVVDAVYAMDDGFYRMEKTYHRTVNDPMALGMYGLSHSTSTLNARALDFIENLGYNQREHWSRYTQDTVVADSLLGFRYILSKTPLEAHMQPILTQGEITVYQNPYALPIIFAANARYTDTSVSSSNPLKFQNQLLSALADDNYVNYFTAVPELSRSLTNLDESTYGSHKRYTVSGGGSGTIEYTIQASTEGPMYCYFPSDYRRACNLSVNGAFVTALFGNETMIVVPLGYFNEGETITVSLRLNEEEALIRNTDHFYVLDLAAFEAAYETLSRSPLEITRRTETYIEGTMTVYDEKACVYTSIPWEGGWTVTVDGVKVPLKMGANALLSFDITEGTHTVTMSYMPPGLLEGSLISLAALLMAAALIAYRRVSGHRV